MAATAAEPRPVAVVQEPLSTRILRVLAKAPLQILLVIVGLFWLVPTIGLFIISLMDPADLASNGWWTFLTKPSELTLDNYRAIFENESITSSLWTTLWIAIGATILPIFIAALAGYAFAWLDFPGRDSFFILVIALLVVPLQMALIPMFSIYNTIPGLSDSVLGIVLFHTAFGLPFAIFLLRNFFIGIPKELLEAARIDGASEIRIFLRLILPLGLPAIASLAIFQFLWAWNDLLVALTFGRETQPITVAIFSQLRQFGANIELIAPASFVSLVIPLARLLRLPALLRAGPARRLCQITVTGQCAIVGGGLAGFVAHATLRKGGLEPAEIAVFGTDPDPAAPWRVRAAAIRQRRMRSESDGHCPPASFPGLAVRAAARRRSVVPLVQSACDRYRPTVGEFLAHVAERPRRERLGRELPPRPHRARAGGGRRFEVDGHGVFAHVLSRPAIRASPPEELEGDPRVVHAYEPHDYADRVEVVGAGMAAATEWLNALDGGRLGRLGPAPRARAPPAQPPPRALHAPRAGRLPPGRAGRARRRAARAGRALLSGGPRAGTSRSSARRARGGSRRSRAERGRAGDLRDRVQAGFPARPASGAARRRARARDRRRLARALRRLHRPALTDSTRTLSVAGAPGQWAFPAADTLAGAKYAARRFLRRIQACRTR